LLKKGVNPKKIKAGKKCIGIAKPGNNSGKSMSNGRFIVIGSRMLKKENKTIATLTIPLNLTLFSLSRAQ